MLWAKVRSLSLKRVAQTKLCSSYHVEENSTYEFQEYLDAYLQKRGAVVDLPNSRPDRVKDNLEAAEKLLFAHTPIKVLWRGHAKDCFQVVMSNGSLISFTFGDSGDITKLEIDSSMHFLVSHSIVAVTWGVQYVVLALENKLLMVLQPKKGETSSVKISDFMVTQNTDVAESVIGMALDEDNKVVLVNTGKSFYLFSLVQEKQGMVLVLTVKYDPRHRSNRIKCAKLSHVHKKTVYCLEERPNEYVDFRILNVAGGKLGLTTSFRFATTERGDVRVKCVDISPDETRCVAGFSDGTVSVYDIISGSEVVVGPFSQSSVCCLQWHKANSVLCICYEEGEIFLCDHALQPIKFCVQHNLSLSNSIPPYVHVNISALLGHKCRIHHMMWGSNGVPGILGPSVRRNSKINGGSYDTIAIVIDRGPVVVVRVELGILSQGRLTNSVIINNRLALRQYKEAIEILVSLATTREFHFCFVSTVNYFFDISDSADVNGAVCDSLSNISYSGLKLEEAFCAAVNIDMPELFKELLMYCKNEPVLLEASIDKLRTRYNMDVVGKSPKEIQFERILQAMMLDQREDVLLEGLTLESEGRLQDAHALYLEHKKEKEIQRLKRVMEILQT